jgi:hypothetical protein
MKAERQMIKMVLILPPGYTTTAPEREIYIYFVQDFSTQNFDLQDPITP